MRMEPGFFFPPTIQVGQVGQLRCGSGEADIYNNGGVTKTDLYGWSTDVNSSFEQIFITMCIYQDSLDGFESYPFANCNQQFPITRGAF